MNEKTRWTYLYIGLGGLATIGQAYLLFHNLVESKPYKIMDPAHMFFYTAYLGIPVSLILCAILVRFLQFRMVAYLLPMAPVLGFPIFVWIIYEIIFAVSGVDLFSGSGDFSVRQNEMAFAYDVIKVLILGCMGGLTFVAISALISKITHTPGQ